MHEGFLTDQLPVRRSRHQALRTRLKLGSEVKDFNSDGSDDADWYEDLQRYWWQL